MKIDNYSLARIPEIGTKTWEKEVMKGIKEGKVKYSLPKKEILLKHPKTPYEKRLLKAPLFLRSVLS